MSDIGILIGGIAVFVITGGVFWALLPDGDKLHRWTNTEWEPYIGVAICSGVAIGVTMILSSVLSMMGT
jgi:hypothetical protein